jgi:hypothetical protein
MKAQFSISVDVPRSLVRMAMAGFFEDDDIARFVNARDQAHQLLQCPRNGHLTLVDIRGMDIQAQDSVTSFQKILADPVNVSKRIAFVVVRSLAWMQIKRAAESREARYFMCPEEAEMWLLGG